MGSTEFNQQETRNLTKETGFFLDQTVGIFTRHSGFHKQTWWMSLGT